MANRNKNPLLVGAAIAAGVIGTLAAFLRSRNHVGFAEKAKKATNRFVDNLKNQELIRSPIRDNRNFMIGSLAGSLVAATTALLLAPKSGKELIKDFSKTLQGHVQHHHRSPSRSHSSNSNSRSHAKPSARKVIRHTAAAKTINRSNSNRSINRNKRAVQHSVHHVASKARRFVR